MTSTATASALVQTVVRWARGRADVVAVALVGSHARGQARPDSDVDVVLLVTDPGVYRDPAWLPSLPWADAGLALVRFEDVDYGVAWSRHLILNDDGRTDDDGNAELELVFAAPTWASTAPVDPGTRAVVTNGCVPLLDEAGLLAKLLAAVRA